MAAALASKAITGVFIVGAKRTPVGSFGGKLKGLTATDLGVIAGSAAIKSAGIDPKHIDSVVFGNVCSNVCVSQFLYSRCNKHPKMQHT